MTELRNEITCVNCWARFAPEDTLWVAEHQDLSGDPVAGSDVKLRFLPSRFNLRGNALDLYGLECRELACPNCHLTIPRSLLEREPVFVSILGTTGCGKSFFLGALASSARRDLPAKLGIHFSDADATANIQILSYEESLFHCSQPNAMVELGGLMPPTQPTGATYRSVVMAGQPVSLPKPFSFLLEAKETHGNYDKTAPRLICLYDNAGEHFLPGYDSTATQGTRHMAEASFLLYIYDPAQDPRWQEMMRQACPHEEFQFREGGKRQEDVLREAATRVRRLRGMTDNEKHNRPLIVVLNKCDLWRDLLPKANGSVLLRSGGVVGVNIDVVAEQSRFLRSLLLRTIPELVYAAERFCTQVYYLPASPIGTKPEYRDSKFYLRPRDIRPEGVLLPFLLGLQLTTSGLVALNTSPPSQGNGQANHWPPGATPGG